MANDQLTEHQERAVRVAKRDGAVFAGVSSHNGHSFSTAASTLRALERRQFLTVDIGPDGGMMGRLTVRAQRWLDGVCLNCGRASDLHLAGCCLPGMQH